MRNTALKLSIFVLKLKVAGSGRAGSFSNSSFSSPKKPLYHGVLSNLMSLFPEIWELIKFGGFQNDHTLGHSAFWDCFLVKFRGSYCLADEGAPQAGALCNFISITFSINIH